MTNHYIPELSDRLFSGQSKEIENKKITQTDVCACNGGHDFRKKVSEWHYSLSHKD
jgi:hypothetical protein